MDENGLESVHNFEFGGKSHSGSGKTDSIETLFAGDYAHRGVLGDQLGKFSVQYRAHSIAELL